MIFGRALKVRRIGTLPLSVLAALALALIVYALLWPRTTRPDATWIHIQETRVLRIGIDPSFPPFAVDDGKGNLSGLDIALAGVLAQRWGVRVQYVYTGYDGLYDALTGNQFDLILSALTYNPTRTQDVSFSHSYFNGGPVLVIRGDDTRTHGIGDLYGRAVAVELGTSGDAYARRWEKRQRLQLIEFNTAGDGLQAALDGRAAAAIVDPISFYDLQRRATGLKLVGGRLTNEYYVIAVRRNAPTLLRELNEVIDGLTRDGTLEEMQKRWF